MLQGKEIFKKDSCTAYKPTPTNSLSFLDISVRSPALFFFFRFRERSPLQKTAAPRTAMIDPGSGITRR